MDLTQLVIHKSAYEAQSLLAEWQRIVGSDLAVLLPTRLGHLFLEHADGTVWFLNTWSGELVRACESYEQFKVRISEDEGFVSEYLMPELIAELRKSGRTADGDACFSPAVSPGIGGSFDPENFVVMSLHAHLATAAAEYCVIHGS